MAEGIKKAFVTGVTGQDGSYLAEFLINKGYEVHGLVRRVSTFNWERIDHIISHVPHVYGKPGLFLHYGDLNDAASLQDLTKRIMPDEVYHLGAQSHVGISFEMPEFTTQATGVSTLRLLEALRCNCPQAKFYQAGSSEMFGKVREIPQKETTPFYPRSPYAASKVYAYWITVNYRESYRMHASVGILFNHESERRGMNFVSRKITSGFAKMMAGKAETLRLGNLYAKRDWGYAKDYVEGMWLMLQQEKPDDYVLATGETHSVKEFVEEVCRLLHIDIVWVGEGMDEKGLDRKTNKVLVEVDPYYFRPAEVDLLIGDAAKAREKLGWSPKVTFKNLARIMLEHDLKAEGVAHDIP